MESSADKQLATAEFRNFPGQSPAGDLIGKYDYTIALAKSFKDSGLALQDIVNRNCLTAGI